MCIYDGSTYIYRGGKEEQGTAQSRDGVVYMICERHTFIHVNTYVYTPYTCKSIHINHTYDAQSRDGVVYMI